MQEILKLLDNSKVIKSYEILSFEQEGSNYFFKCKISLINGTFLFVLESFRENSINYSYHWQDLENKLIIRWDNAPHHKDLETFPYHMHNPDLQPSSMINLEEVLKMIQKKILDQ